MSKNNHDALARVPKKNGRLSTAEIWVIILVSALLIGTLIPTTIAVVRERAASSALAQADGALKAYRSTLSDMEQDTDIVLFINAADGFYVYGYRPASPVINMAVGSPFVGYKNADELIASDLLGGNDNDEDNYQGVFSLVPDDNKYPALMQTDTVSIYEGYISGEYVATAACESYDITYTLLPDVKASEVQNMPTTATLIKNAVHTVRGTGILRDGYSFSCWYDAAHPEREYAVGQPLTVTESVTLVAKWASNQETHTITFDNSDCAVTQDWRMQENSVTLPAGTDAASYIAASYAAKDGSVFKGWRDNGGVMYTNGFIGAVPLNTDMTLTAIWSKSVALNYTAGAADVQNVTDMPFSPAVASGNSIVLSNSVPTRNDNKLFYRWRCAEDGVYYAPGATIVMSESAKTMEAVWVNPAFTVEYLTYDQQLKGMPSPLKITVPLIDGTGIFTVANAPARDGFRFDAWGCTLSKLGKEIPAGATFEYDGSFAGETIALTAKTSQLYSLTYRLCTGTISTVFTEYHACGDIITVWDGGKTPVYDANDAKHTFIGWGIRNGSQTMPIKYLVPTGFKYHMPQNNVVMDTQWTTEVYKVTYSAGAGVTDSAMLPMLSSAAANTSVFVRFAPKRAGYEFIAWQLDGAQYQPGDTFIMQAQDVTFQAIWAKKYAVTFKSDIDCAGLPDNTNLVSEAAYQLPDICPVANGDNAKKLFAGWNSSTDDILYSAGDMFRTPDSDVTFTAKWADGYTLSYALPTCVNASPMLDSKVYAQGVSVRLPDAEPESTDASKVFVCWNDGNANYLPGDSFTVPSADTVMSAVFEKPKLLTYISETDTHSMPELTSQNVVPGRAYVVDRTVPTRDGYTFSGWQVISGGALNPAQEIITVFPSQVVNLPESASGYRLLAIWSQESNTDFKLNIKLHDVVNDQTATGAISVSMQPKNGGHMLTADDILADFPAYRLTDSDYTRLITTDGAGVLSETEITLDAYRFEKINGEECKVITTAYAFDSYINAHLSDSFCMGDDITLEKDFTPIGRENNIKVHAFSGKLYGNGYTVKLPDMSIDGGYVGLFARNEGQIFNVKLSSENVSGAYCVGGLCGINEGVVSDCHVTSKMTESTSYAFMYMGSADKYASATGGIVGLNLGTITLCGFNGAVRSALLADVSSIEGIAGCIGGIAGINAGCITRTWSYANINSAYYQSTAVCENWYYIGGLAGMNAKGGDISDCWARTMAAGTYGVGGLCGMNDATAHILGCWSAVRGLTCQNAADTACGNVVGNTTNRGEVEYCYYEAAADAGQGTRVTSLIVGSSLNGFTPEAWKYSSGSRPQIADNASKQANS